jgi:glycosyltransferase involved in cell wall biosynthesis
VSWTTVLERPLPVGAISEVPAAADSPAPVTTRVTTSVIIPAYNEEEGVGVVIRQLQEAVDDSYELIVVDDGSTDRTAEAAALPGVTVIRHEQNRGKGAALVTGFDAASTDRLITLDADGTYPAEMVPVLADALREHDLVVGVRQGGRENISPLNRAGNAFFRFAISVAARRRVGDPLTGLYGIRRSAIDRMDLRSNGFGIEAEIAIKAGRLGLSAIEFPIDYRSRIGTSKLHPWRDGMVILRTIQSHALSPIAQQALAVDERVASGLA